MMRMMMPLLMNLCVVASCFQLLLFAQVASWSLYHTGDTGQSSQSTQRDRVNFSGRQEMSVKSKKRHFWKLEWTKFELDRIFHFFFIFEVGTIQCTDLPKTEFLAVVSKMAILSQTVIFDLWVNFTHFWHRK